MQTEPQLAISSFLLNEVYSFNQLNVFTDRIKSLNLGFSKDTKKICWLNAPAAFDIETTSTYTSDGGKVAFMYVWQFGVCGVNIYGRTWEQFDVLISRLVRVFNLGGTFRMVVYVHNLSYEFQFLCRRFEWEKVFALDDRKPVKARTVNGIEFRCSYILTGCSLSDWSEHFNHFKMEKLTGDLDYSKVRHSDTPLSEQELGYCIRDIQIVQAGIYEKMQAEGGYIWKIPLTKTGYVRRRFRRACTRQTKEAPYKWLNNNKLMCRLTLEPGEYELAKAAFQGGFTHAHYKLVGVTVNDVASYDLASSYPTVMVSELFPMSKGQRVEPNNKLEFRQYLKKYCCLFNIKFVGLTPRLWHDNPLSASKCKIEGSRQINNGRVVWADTVYTSLTEQDFFTLEKFYEWDHMAVGTMYVYRRGHLPTDFVNEIITLYESKTTLKGVKGSELDYLLSKQDINSAYGMCVTDICRDENIYNVNGWCRKSADVSAEIEKYNNSKGRFLSYLWGVWVTAYARRNLFSAIYELGQDYVYSDTDSVKFINAEKHMDYFERYNSDIQKRVKNALKYHKIDETKAAPRTIKGLSKPLGVWEYEGTYTRFKTLGAKRYMTEIDGQISITLSGVNKKKAVPWLLSQDCDPFELFKEGLFFPEEATGKNTHTYIDSEQEGYIVDYNGLEGQYHEYNSVHLSGASYDMTFAREFKDYLKRSINEILQIKKNIGQKSSI